MIKIIEILTQAIWVIFKLTMKYVIIPIMKEVLRWAALIALQALKLLLIAIRELLIFSFNLIIIGTLTKAIKAIA